MYIWKNKQCLCVCVCRMKANLSCWYCKIFCFPYQIHLEMIHFYHWVSFLIIWCTDSEAQLCNPDNLRQEERMIEPKAGEEEKGSKERRKCIFPFTGVLLLDQISFFVRLKSRKFITWKTLRIHLEAKWKITIICFTDLFVGLYLQRQ